MEESNWELGWSVTVEAGDGLGHIDGSRDGKNGWCEAYLGGTIGEI